MTKVWPVWNSSLFPLKLNYGLPRRMCFRYSSLCLIWSDWIQIRFVLCTSIYSFSEWLQMTYFWFTLMQSSLNKMPTLQPMLVNDLICLLIRLSTFNNTLLIEIYNANRVRRQNGLSIYRPTWNSNRLDLFASELTKYILKTFTLSDHEPIHNSLHNRIIFNQHTIYLPN